MAKARKKAVEIEFITFDEFIEYGHKFIEENPTEGNYGLYDNGNERCGLPWHFKYQGHPITHENDECYLIPTLEGTLHFTPKDVLITGVKGEIYPCKIDIFEATYDKIIESSELRINELPDLKNGDSVRYSGGLTYTFVGVNPFDESISYCIDEYGKIKILPTEKLIKFKKK